MNNPDQTNTTLENHYSIFSIAFRHSVSYKTLVPWKKKIDDLGWRPHDFLRGSGPRSGIEEESEKGVTPFLPQIIFTPNAQEMTFGFSGTQPNKLDDEVFKNRLNPNKGIINKTNKHHIDNIILSLDPSPANYLKKYISIKTSKDSFITFTIEWADTWFFNDETGILSFKAKISSVTDSGTSRSPLLGDINTLNRLLRDTSNSGPNIYCNDEQTSEISFWDNLVFQLWLGSNKTYKGNLFSPDKKSDDFRREHIDANTRYAKLLTMSRLPNLAAGEAEFLWNAPVTDPAVDFQPYYQHAEKKQWHETFSAYHFATMENYPTRGDYLLYDLATCGDTGDAGGFTGKRGWQVSPEYLRSLLQDNSIEIWEYWRGIALHDTLAFLAYDESMPIDWQAEAYYYPLHTYLYHIQFRLNCFSEEIIDEELSDVLQAREIKNRFYIFRNQYWFRDITVDFQGVEITDKLKTGLEIDTLYEMVESEIADVSEFIDEKINKGKQSLLAFLLLAFYPITYIFEMSGIGETLTDLGSFDPILSISVMLVVILLLGLLVLRFMSLVSKNLLRLYGWFYKSYQ